VGLNNIEEAIAATERWKVHGDRWDWNWVDYVIFYLNLPLQLPGRTFKAPMSPLAKYLLEKGLLSELILHGEVTIEGRTIRRL
jgi:hypothetical protein